MTQCLETRIAERPSGEREREPRMASGKPTTVPLDGGQAPGTERSVIPTLVASGSRESKQLSAQGLARGTFGAN